MSWQRVADTQPPAKTTGITGRYCSHGHAMTEANTRLRFRRRDKRHGSYWERDCKKCRNEAQKRRYRFKSLSENRYKRPCRICGNTCLGRSRNGTRDGLCGNCRAKEKEGNHERTSTH